MGRDQTSTEQVCEFIVQIHKDHLGGFEGNQAKDLRKDSYYRGWHYHCEHPRYSQRQIMIILEHALRSMRALKIPFSDRALGLGNVHELDPKNTSIWVKTGRKLKKDGYNSVKSTVLWIGKYGKLHIETNKVEKYVKGIFTKANLIEALRNYTPICETCNRQMWARSLKKCKDCGKWVCRYCRKIFFPRKVKKVKIKGKYYKIEDLIFCRTCGKEYECEYCEEFPTEEEWTAHLNELQQKCELREPPYKLYIYHNCVFCGKFVCDLHSLQLNGVFEKYGEITVCNNCLESKVCIKCGEKIVYKRWGSAKFNKKRELTCYECNKKVRIKRSDTLKSNYEKHSEFQSTLKEFFEKMLGLRVRLERCLEKSYSVDFVLVNPKTKLTYGMELKTGKVSKQISTQLEHYAKFFDYFYVLVREGELNQLIDRIEERYGVFMIDEKETSIALIRNAQHSDLSKERLLELMKPFALRWITIDYKLGIKPTVLREMKREELAQVISKRLDAETIRDIYSEYVLGQKYVWWFSITNKEYYEMYPKLQPKAQKSLPLNHFIKK